MSNPDPFDVVLDARSEERYGDGPLCDPNAEPYDVEHDRIVHGTAFDESAGFLETDKWIRGKR